jgi:hypothetical protein
VLLVPHGKYNGIHPLHRAERQHRYQVQQTGERTGISTLLTFSIPLPTPNARMTIATTRATICQKLFPNADAMDSNAPAKSSTLTADSVFPVKVPIMYLKIHPMTTV